MWIRPAYTDLRLGSEITLYISIAERFCRSPMPRFAGAFI